MPALIAIGRVPLVLLKMAPAIAPATTLLVGSCLPRSAPMVLLVPLYTSAMTPALLPRKGPRRVTALRMPLRRNRGGMLAGFFCRPSLSPQAPPMVSAVR